MRVRRAVALLLGAVVLVGLAARIWWVNSTLPSVPVLVHEQGEWVSLEGAFHNTSDEETENYSFMVESAQVMTYDEYLQTYGADEGTTEEGLKPRAEPGTHGDARCVVSVSLRVRNSGDTQGWFNVFQMVLVPERGNEYLICDIMNDSALWPQVQQGASGSVSVQPGTEYTLHIPYVFNGTEEVYQREIADRSFTLLLSRMPVRHMVRVSAP